MEKKPFEEWTPAEVVAELDRHVVGQAAAKRAVAIALRNRWRRKRVDPAMRDDVLPKNILMIGPTGVGKTEIARRLAKLLGAPFLKVEATKYTEVGYVGKDVESMIRDLVEASITLVQQEAKKAVALQAKEASEERLLDLLLPPGPYGIAPEAAAGELSTREKLRERLKAGAFEDREVEIEVRERVAPNSELFSMPGFDQLDNNLQDMLGSLVPKRSKRRKLKLREARPVLEAEEAQRLVDMDRVIPQALELAQQSGIVFLDELDKIAEPETAVRSQAAVSREGVQRDLLPIIEGATVNTKYGPVKTDHVLFIGAGAFHKSKPSDLIPELQGRFPIRVELTSLGVDDFVRILREPEHSLLQQYEALLATEQVTLTFDDDAVRGMAETAARVNESMENIGARRLHTILERVLEEVSFTAPEIVGQSVTVTAQYVRDRVSDVARDQDLGRFIL